MLYQLLSRGCRTKFCPSGLEGPEAVSAWNLEGLIRPECWGWPGGRRALEGASQAAQPAQPEPQGSGRRGAQHGRLCRGLQGAGLSVWAGLMGVSASTEAIFIAKLSAWNPSTLSAWQRGHCGAICGACGCSLSGPSAGAQLMPARRQSRLQARQRWVWVRRCWVWARLPSLCSRRSKLCCRQAAYLHLEP